MRPRGNPNIVKDGEKTRLKPGNCHEVQSMGVEAAKESYARRKTFREIAAAYGPMPDDELKGKTNDEAVIIALYREAKQGNVQAIDKLLNLFGEMVFKGEFQMTPMEGMARMREHREKQSQGDE